MGARSFLLRLVLLPHAVILSLLAVTAAEAELSVYRGTQPGCADVVVGPGQRVVFSGGAASSTGSLESVSWYVDGRLTTTSPIRNRWSEDRLRFAHAFYQLGSHAVSMYVFDGNGNRADPFTVTVSDPDADVHGVEWYVDDRFIDAQYRERVGGRRHLTVFSRRFASRAAGARLTVSAVPFDRRGHYGRSLSWTVDVAPRPRFLYVGLFDRILPSGTERKRLISFVRENGITHLALYRLHWLFPKGWSEECDGRSQEDLVELVLSLRNAGVQRIYGAVSGAAYYCNHMKSVLGPGGFDGVVTELEFWNPKSGVSWEEFMGELSALRETLSGRQLCAAPSGMESAAPSGMEIGVYVGKASFVQAETIAAFADRVLLATYVDDPDETYDQADRYLRRFHVSRARPSEVWPIFSAEDETDKVSSCRVTDDREAFMGEWLRDPRRADPIGDAEERFLMDWKAESGTWKYGIHVGGIAWFEYNVLENDVRSTDGNVAPRACHWYGEPGAGDPYMAVAPAERRCGIQTVTFAANESYTFQVKAWDDDGNLTATIWSGWEHPDVHYDAAGDPGRQYVSGTVGGSGDQALFARRYRFSVPGEYEIRVRALDRRESYGPELLWRVQVE
jgi:hypothetical protein